MRVPATLTLASVRGRRTAPPSRVPTASPHSRHDSSTHLVRRIRAPRSTSLVDITSTVPGWPRYWQSENSLLSPGPWYRLTAGIRTCADRLTPSVTCNVGRATRSAALAPRSLTKGFARYDHPRPELQQTIPAHVLRGRSQ